MHGTSQGCSNEAAEHENMTVDLRVAGHLQLVCVFCSRCSQHCMKIYEYEHTETYFELSELLWCGMLIYVDCKSQLSADNSSSNEKKKELQMWAV